MDDRKVHVITAGGAGSTTIKKQGTTTKKSKKTKSSSTTGGGSSGTTTTKKKEASPQLPQRVDLQNAATTATPISTDFGMEMEPSDREQEDDRLLGYASSSGSSTNKSRSGQKSNTNKKNKKNSMEEGFLDEIVEPVKMETLIQEPPPTAKTAELFWLFLCFLGIMVSFVVYGVLLEYTTSGGRKLHELSFLFVTSGLYTLTAAAGRYVRDETPTTIPPARFAILGLTSMGSTFCSVRSLRYVCVLRLPCVDEGENAVQGGGGFLRTQIQYDDGKFFSLTLFLLRSFSLSNRYVIYPIQVLAKSCKPVPVMLMGALMGKKYGIRKYINVAMIVSGVALFMGGGDKRKKDGDVGEERDDSASSQLIGLVLLFISLCFDGGTGAYEDKLMSVHSVQPFDLMYNIQLGKTILAGVSLLVLNQVHVFVQMCSDMGFLLVALGLSGALGQVFIFVTIAKFGALTCSIIGLARKITTLVFSIWYFGHYLNGIQMLGLFICVGSMIMNFMGKSKKGGKHGGGHGDGGGHHSEPSPPKQDQQLPEDMQKMLSDYEDEPEGDVEMAGSSSSSNRK